MTDLATPYAPAAPEAAAYDEHAAAHEPHLSPWPIVAGFGAPVLALGVVLLYVQPLVLVVGAIAVLVGLVGWVHEDIKGYPHGQNPLTAHTMGEKDNGWWGIVLFLATEVVLFGSLFAVFFAARAEQLATTGLWPMTVDGHQIHLPILMTGINTAILVTSGFVMMWGEHGLKKNQRGRFVTGFVGAFLLGAVFLGIQLVEYVELAHEGLLLSSNVFGSTFYILTGTHGFHVLGGLVFLAIVAVRAMLGQYSPERHASVTAAAYYWHFVDVVWILLYAIVYLQVI